MSSPLISIIIPVYNTESYLIQCLDSLINQSLKNIEIIIVNDCSPDDSEGIITQYIAQDKRIRYVKHESNLGLGGARNSGIKEARGKYLAFVDSDDWLKPECLQKMLALMEKYKANLGVFSALKFDHESGTSWYAPYFDIRFTNPCPITAESISKTASTAWNKIYKTEDVRSAGVLFPEHLKHEDEEFWFKYAAKVKPLAVGDPTPYYQYRQRRDSIMAGIATSRKDMPQIMINIFHFWQKEGLLEAYRESLFPLFFWSYEWYAHEIAPRLRPDFAKGMLGVFSLFGLDSEEVFRLNPKLIVFYIEDEKLRHLFFGLIDDVAALYHNKWYRFGQLSRRQKVKKIISVLLKKIRLYNIFASVYHWFKGWLHKS